MSALPAPRRALALALMIASGFAGLGYQIVWTQQLGLWLGHEAAAVLAVVAAFFGGLAVGALALGPRIERSARPLRWYLACELAIAAWGLLLALTMPTLSAALRELMGVEPSPVRQWGLAFAGCLLLLLPATAAMGATLPAMERLATQWRELGRQPGRSIAGLYAANTAGAVLGVLLVALWSVPEWGLQRSALLCAALNLACAAAAALALPRRVSPVPPASPLGTEDRRRLGALLVATGLLGIAYEVLVVRVLAQVAEDTVYTFALMLAVYLVGSALGAAAWQRRVARARTAGPAAMQSRRLLLGLALACALGGASLWFAETLRDAVLVAAGPGLPAALAAEAALAVAAFLLPTLLMGALFSQLCDRAAAAGIGYGRALGLNTLGAAVAPLLFGVLLAPALGPKLALLLLPLGYGLLAGRSAWQRPRLWLPAGALAAGGLLAPPLAFVSLPAGGELLSYRDGTLAAVSVVADAQGVARLHINNRQQEGSNATARVDGRQALLPLLLHPQPQRALFLGLGTGVTAHTAAQDPSLRVDAVELLPEVIAASALFTQELRPRAPLRLVAADARHFVLSSGERYDLIVADNFHPARSGSAALYTVEHFGAVRSRLAPQGLFCQWLPLHQLDLATLRSITASFLAAFPDATALLASNSLETPVLGLVGRVAASAPSLAAARQRLQHTQLAVAPARYGLEDEYALLGSYVAGPQALHRLARAAVPNTDDRPVVAQLAPRITYAPSSMPRERLASLLAELTLSPAELGIADDEEARRLGAYWAARRQFIEAGMRVQASRDVRLMLAQVQEPLLAVLRISADFRPAYEPLLSMAAAALHSGDTARARPLLLELQGLQPQRTEAGELLARIAASAP